MAAVVTDAGGGGNNATPKLVRRNIATGSAFSMTSGQTMRCVITTTGGAGGPQTLTVYVNGTSRLTSTAIDDDWAAGQVGLIALSGSGSQLDFDNFKVGFDNNGDADIADLGDDIKLSDAFGSTTINLTYDDNGNLTNDGVFDYDYDAWNRMVAAKTADQDNVLIGTYSYDGLNRRIKKVVSNQGVEIFTGDGGDTTVNFYYDFGWRILETRNGSNQTNRQWVFGTQYTDEIVLMDVNGDPTIGNDANPDVNTNGESGNDDHRYFYHQDRNWNVIALTDYGSGVNGNIVERYSYTPHGDSVVLARTGSGGEFCFNRSSSLIGNMFTYQGRMIDVATCTSQNRHRDYHLATHAFLQRDPLPYLEGPISYFHPVTMALDDLDPLGLSSSLSGSEPLFSPPRPPSTSCSSQASSQSACELSTYTEIFGEDPGCYTSLPPEQICQIACAPGGQCWAEGLSGCVMCNNCGEHIPCSCEPYFGGEVPNCDHPIGPNDCILCHEQTHIDMEDDLDCSHCCGDTAGLGCRPSYPCDRPNDPLECAALIAERCHGYLAR